MAAQKTFTATFAGVTAEVTTSRKIAWATFLLYNGQWKLATDGFHAGKRESAEKEARATVAINRNRGFTAYKVVPAIVAE